MEYFNFALLETKAEEPEGQFSGYASTYGLDLVGDKIVPGAFAKSIAETRGKIPIFFNHRPDAWVGFSKRLAEDEKGLAFTAKLVLKSSHGRDAYELLIAAQENDFKVGMSIGFRSKDWEMDGSIRLLKEIQLFEASITPSPAQPRARVIDVKTVRELEQFLREEGCSNTDAKAWIRRVRESEHSRAPHSQREVEAVLRKQVRNDKLVTSLRSALLT